MTRATTTILALLMLGAGCGGEESIRASDYDQSCDLDVDCVAVAEGEKCDIERCGCPFVAINQLDEARYRQDLDALTCNEFDPLGGGLSCLCVSVEAVCIDGACDAQQASPGG